MDLRQTINERPRLAAAAAGLIIIAALAFTFLRGGSGGVGAARGEQAYYSVDDGKTWFADDAAKIPPFQHEGKPAYRVKVFRCAGGAAFVSHLERYSEADKRRLDSASPASGAGMVGPQQATMLQAVEVKKPGEAEWIRMTPQTSAAYLNVIQPKCPNGTGDCEPVLPG